MGTEFWGGMIDWIKNTMLEQFHNISPQDLDLIHLTDDPDEAVKIICDFYNEADLRPNF